jgi:hypothetical protein
MVKAKARRSYREAAQEAAKGIHLLDEWQPIRPVKILAEFYCGPGTIGKLLGIVQKGLYRPNDADNAIGSLKSFIDGLVDAGMVPDDSHKWISWENPRLYRTEKEHQGRCEVVLTITQEDRKN